MENIKNDVLKEIENINDTKSLYDVRVKYLGKKGIISELLANLGKLSIEEKKKQYREIETVILPDMMTGIGIKKFTLGDGSEITIKDVVQASLPSRGAILKAQGDERDALIDRNHRALDWMRANGGEAIIKNNISVDFGKGQDEIADRFVDFCKEIGMEYDRSTTVHNASLTSYIKEKLASGANVPLDLFSVYTGFKAVIKQPRKIG